VPGDYPQLLSAIKSRIQNARILAHLAANRELVQLYWDIGKLIVERQKIEEWGKGVVERLSADLSAEFHEMNGLSLSNLWRMRSFFLAYLHLPEILAQPVRDLDASGEPSENLAQPVRDLAPYSNLRQAVADFKTGKTPSVLLAIPWGHNITLTEKLKDPALRLWYAAQIAEHGPAS